MGPLKACLKHKCIPYAGFKIVLITLEQNVLIVNNRRCVQILI